MPTGARQPDIPSQQFPRSQPSPTSNLTAWNIPFPPARRVEIVISCIGIQFVPGLDSFPHPPLFFLTPSPPKLPDTITRITEYLHVSFYL